MSTGPEGQCRVDPVSGLAGDIYNAFLTKPRAAVRPDFEEEASGAREAFSDIAEAIAAAVVLPLAGDVVIDETFATTTKTAHDTDAWEVGNGSTTHVRLVAVAHCLATNEGAVYVKEGAIRKSSVGVATFMAATPSTPTAWANEDAGAATWDASLQLVGDNLVVRVGGEDGKTIAWHVVVRATTVKA